MNNKADYIKLIQTECLLLKIDADLLCSIVTHESSWNKEAYRYEKKYDFLVLPSKYAALNKISDELEIEFQKTSIGLFQLMGGNFRMLGYDKFLAKAFDPEVNIKFGVQFFKRRCDIHADIRDKASAFNMGTPTKKPDGKYINQDYVDTVMKIYENKSFLL